MTLRYGPRTLIPPPTSDHQGLLAAASLAYALGDLGHRMGIAPPPRYAVRLDRADGSTLAWVLRGRLEDE